MKTLRHKIIKEYLESLHLKKIGKWKVYKFYTHMTYLNPEDVSHLNRPTTNSEIEAAVKSSKKERPRMDRFTAEFY